MLGKEAYAPSGSEAVECGLINEVVGEEELMKRAEEIAEKVSIFFVEGSSDVFLTPVFIDSSSKNLTPVEPTEVSVTQKKCSQ